MLSAIIHGPVWFVLVSSFLYLVVYGLGQGHGEESII